MRGAGHTVTHVQQRRRSLSDTPRDAVGLCARCVHARIIRTARSMFWLCELAREDARFERYPRLPVLTCAGHEALPAGARVAEGPPSKT